MTRICFLPVAITLLCFAAGCGGGGEGPARYPVSGTVTFDGEPVPQGEIRFVPTGGAGAADAAQIVEGKFETSATPGPKRVEIVASRENPEKMIESAVNPGQKEPAREDYIPERYNTKSELKEEVKDGPNTFRFDLKSSGS